MVPEEKHPGAPPSDNIYETGQIFITFGRPEWRHLHPARLAIIFVLGCLGSRYIGRYVQTVRVDCSGDRFRALSVSRGCLCPSHVRTSQADANN